MMKLRSLAVLVITAILTIGGAGCGTSGSNPVEFAEVHFDVKPSGQFTVTSLLAGGVRHSSIEGQTFATTSTFTIILENAAPPYQGVFTRLPDSNELTVTVSVIAPRGQTSVSDVTLPDKDTAVITCMAASDAPAGIHCMGGEPPMPEPTLAANPEIRFDVCAPSPNASSCFTPGDSGFPGIAFSGTLGDLLTTHLLGGMTPTIFFLEGASHSINAVFRSSVVDQALLAQLFLNGALRQSRSGSGDVVIREDL
jgi:hypothetical protein